MVRTYYTYFAILSASFFLFWLSAAQTIVQRQTACMSVLRKTQAKRRANIREGVPEQKPFAHVRPCDKQHRILAALIGNFPLKFCVLRTVIRLVRYTISGGRRYASN